jgi:hypothetical protein
MNKLNLIIEQLRSWSKSYIPPSAAITMDEAVEMLIKQDDEIYKLKEEIKVLKEKPLEHDEPVKATRAKKKK